MTELSVVGMNAIRLDDLEKVTGMTKYTAECEESAL